MRQDKRERAIAAYPFILTRFFFMKKEIYSMLLFIFANTGSKYMYNNLTSVVK